MSRISLTIFLLGAFILIGGGVFLWQSLFSTKEMINTQDWLLYTDRSVGENYLGYSVPDWILSVKLPSNVKGENGIFLLEDMDTQEFSGVELRVQPNLLGAELKEEQKELIVQYQNMNLRDIVVNTLSEKVLKVDNIAIQNGCTGPQVFVEGLDYSPDIVGYQTFCVVGSDIGDTTIVFELIAKRKDVKSLDSYKSLYDTILSTFRFVDINGIDQGQVSLYLADVDGFGYGIERIGELKQIEDVNNDGYNEIFVSANGSGGTCVGGTNYKVLYSQKDREYFIVAKSFLESLPRTGREKTLCTISNSNQNWEGCGDGYLDYVCFSNNLQKEKNAAFKEYLESRVEESG